MIFKEEQFNSGLHETDNNLSIENICTPAIQTNYKGTEEWEETHRKKIQKEKKSIRTVQQDIAKHYNIDLSHTISLRGAHNELEREVCAFTILTNKETGEKYYADGYTDHANLLNEIFLNFYSEINITNREDLPDDFFKKWEIKKGFIDPYSNGFKNFEKIHEILKEIILKNQSDNKESVENIKNNPKAKLPNWIISERD